MHANADRVTELVDKANAAHEKLEGSTARIGESSAKIDEAEKIMVDLKERLKQFEANQVSVFDNERTQIEKLSADTEVAVQGLDGKLDAAVARTRADVENTFVDMNAKLHTFCTGVKAEVHAEVQAGQFGAGGGAGKGIGLRG